MLDQADPVARAAAAAALGQRSDLSDLEVDALVQAAANDDDQRVRAAAVAALVRSAPPEHARHAWSVAVRDDEPVVRRRAADMAPSLATAAPGAAVVPALIALLDDHDLTVVESAAWALGELGDDAVGEHAVAPLAAVAGTHEDALAREAAVAALGALGHRDGLAAILVACSDKPAVRRRAVLALAPFEGDDVTAALERALEDRDWQVRQAAEDLLGVDGG